MKISTAILGLFCLIGCWLPSLWAEDALPADHSEILFARRIAPLLREKCAACHGQQADEIEGGLDVTSLETLTAGGDSAAPGIVPGDPQRSSIYLAALREDADFSAMPPKQAERLSEEQLRWLADWIRSGAAWPSEQRQEAIQRAYASAWSVEDGVRVATSGGLSPAWTNRRYDPQDLWAYQPLRPLEVSEGDRAEIDVLIDEALPAELQPAPPATRGELIRRATFDLTGLPPTPEEWQAFLDDPRPDREAFADVVDRLLASPHYGERMAQHWLDVVRYADSSGFANDFERGNAWRYRDYVIRSFNNDKPYDRFLKEQLAGDEIMPDDPEGVIATGFLRMGPWELTGMEVERIARQRFLDDVTNSVGETFLGHSLQCARCHDHKFDPVPTRDYYRIQAVFATTQLADRKAAFLDDENTEGFEEKRFLSRARQSYRETQQQLQEVLATNAQAWFVNRLAPAETQHNAKAKTKTKAKTKISELQQRWNAALAAAQQRNPTNAFDAARSGLMKAGVAQDDLPPRYVGFTPQQHGLRRISSKGLQRLNWEFDRYQPYAHSVYNGHTPTLVRVQSPLRMPQNRTDGELESSCIRSAGDPFATGESVQPGTLSVLDELVAVQIPTGLDGRRTRLAEWIADADNPLTTRVIANRVWQWLFGTALAGNPNNFGSTGRRPTHPRLLDYLASTFVAEGWSIKKLQRRILLSEAYRRSSQHPHPQRLAELDPEGKFLAVFPPRRLSAEELRDAMLAVSGELNPTLGGIPCRPEINLEVALQPRQVMGTFASAWVPNPLPTQRHRRSIYVLKLRGLLHPMLEVFNSPAPDFSCERRESSTVTPQVFSLFNSHNSYARALALANRGWSEVSESENTPADPHRDARAIERCIELAYSRPATAEEVQTLLAHWQAIENQLPAEPRAAAPVPRKVRREAVEENTGERFAFEEKLFANEEFQPDLQAADVDRHVRALGDVCLVMFNSNEFVYVY
ncbi:PSD1 and planctomycete cytochrome C domain-containing protein [Roseimaritima ulvae]|uniref:Planctomycete cytochrome C n=1 Tax=Roseimaritima ulvae TaxID=980254 RepID=A0A5B9QUR9_9BACT|nr:DUF1549 domain-containing protein [Roseimaritima ulvae]QEG41692.1 Planctomycete cytochrome C [Roseimaritima ulvae]